MRKHINIDGIVTAILGELIDKKRIVQDQVFCFIDKLAEAMNLFGTVPLTTPYKAMKSRVEEIWQYREWENMTAEQAFLYGQLYGSIKLCEYRKKEAENDQWLEFLSVKYRSKLWLFHAIKETPGIQHRKLADEGNLSVARLSQIMGEEDMEKLVSYRISGREKYYFLSPQGKELLARLDHEWPDDCALIGVKRLLDIVTNKQNNLSRNAIWDYVLLNNNSAGPIYFGDRTEAPKNVSVSQDEQLYRYKNEDIGGSDECLEITNNYSQIERGIFRPGLKTFSGR